MIEKYKPVIIVNNNIFILFKKLFFKKYKWLEVIKKPKVIQVNVFNKGISVQLNTLIILEGHITLNSIDGEIDPWMTQNKTVVNQGVWPVNSPWKHLSSRVRYKRLELTLQWTW